MKEPGTSFHVAHVGGIFMVVLGQDGRWNVPVANHLSEALAVEHMKWLNAVLDFPDITMPGFFRRPIGVASGTADAICAKPVIEMVEPRLTGSIPRRAMEVLSRDAHAISCDLDDDCSCKEEA